MKSYETCIRNKPIRHPPYGKMQSANAPLRPWQWITIDFITQLPESEGFNSIQVITDQLTKYVDLTPVKRTMTAEEMAHQLLKKVITNHRMPEKITSDQDKLFTLKFWTMLMKLMGINHQLTMAYHPQGNSQTKQTNQTIEQYLWHYINYQQNDWVNYLPTAQFTFNNTKHTAM